MGPQTARQNPELRSLRKKHHGTLSLQGPDYGEMDPKLRWEEHGSENLPSMGKVMYDCSLKDILSTKRVRGGLKNLLVPPPLTLHFMERIQQPRIVK